ncbi:MAG: hypothetical protein KF911_05130 [Pseudomonadales bacterium]|nr:hypothetical protein [Pseudomonadales bacterium]
MTRHLWLVVPGVLLLGYALLGNYVALPGYLRFLERGGTSAAGNAFDLDVLVGATKTIVWMYSFQLGVLCLAVAWARARDLRVRALVVGVLAWLTLWSWPSLPLPGAWFYVAFGSALLVGIAAVLLGPKQPAGDSRSTLLFLGALIFFAFATWEVCGLGSTGRMLHPEQAAQPIAHNLLVTQSSKLMIEFVIAWGLLLLALRAPATPG